MSSPQQNRPAVTLYPSSQEDVNAYMAAIRLASSVRNSMDAQRAGVDGNKVAVNADYDRHLPNVPPPPPADPATPGGREPVPILNQTSSAHFASSSVDTGMRLPCEIDALVVVAANLSTLVGTPTGATLDALEQHQGHFPPPEPPIGSNILAIRSTAMCEAPTGFAQRVACGHLDGWFVLGFFVLFSIMGLAWMKVRTHRTERLDEENEGATWPGISRVSSNSSEAKLRENIRKALREHHGLEDESSTEQYVPVAWRSAFPRAERANSEGRISHDAGPVAVLPET